MSIAIQTTYRKLVDSIASDSQLYIGAVTYVDYQNHRYAVNNFFYPVMHKRSSFAHESEVRLVKCLYTNMNDGADFSPLGIDADWPVTKTLEEIYVNPYAPEYYHQVVASIVQRITPSLSKNVKWSQMRSDPVY